MPLNASDLPLLELLCCAQEFDASERSVLTFTLFLLTFRFTLVLRVPVVVGISVVSVIVAIATVVATVVVPAVPGRISVVCPAVIHHRGAVPAASPTAIPPNHCSSLPRRRFPHQTQ